MAQEEEHFSPTPLRMLVSLLITVLVVIGIWKLIDYRTQPPPPPHPVGVRVNP